MAPISNASRLAEFGSGIGTDGAVLQVDNTNKRIGIGTTNPQAMLQVGTGVSVYGNAGIVSATDVRADTLRGDGSNITGVVGVGTLNVRTNTLTSSGIVTITNTTDSTSTTTGALLVSGGVGIAKSLHVGQNITIGGTLTYEDVTNIDSLGIVTARAGVNVSGGQIQVGAAFSVGNAGVATAAGFVGPLTGNVTGNVSGSSGSATGNAGGLTGTPNISCGTIAGSTGTFTGDVDIADKIVHTGDTNTAIRFPSADTITFETNGDQALEITSGGGVKFNDADTPGSSTAPAQILNHAGGWQFYASSDSNTNRDIIFGSNNGSAGEKFRITDTGQVGINSAAPNFDLDIRGGGSRDGVSVGTTVFIYSQSHATTTSNKAELRFGYNHSGNNYAHGYIFLEEQGGNAFDGRMSFGVPYNNGGGGSSTRHVLQLQGSTGNVGIGTTIPVASSSAYNSAALHIHQTSNSSAGSQIHLTNGATGGAAGNGSHISMYTDDDLYIVNQESDGRIKFGSGGVSDCLTIDDSGNTIIQGNLTVQGTEGNSGIIQIYSDQGDDNEDKYRFLKSSGNHNLVLQNYTGGSWTTNATFGNDESVVFAGQVDGTTFVDSKGSLRSIPQLTKNSQHALVASDAGQCCFSSSGGFVINDSVMSSGDAVTLINNSGSSMTITQGSGVSLYNTDDGSTGNKTLKARGIATVWFSTASIGYITGNFE